VGECDCRQAAKTALFVVAGKRDFAAINTQAAYLQQSQEQHARAGQSGPACVALRAGRLSSGPSMTATKRRSSDVME
jgi:hypothetical protein